MPADDQPVPPTRRRRLINSPEALSVAVGHWKTLAVGASMMLAGVWYGVTWADDKLRKIEKIPRIEQAVLDLKKAHEEAHARDDERAAQMRADNAAIIQRLDLLLEARQGE